MLIDAAPILLLDGSTGHELKQRLSVLGTDADTFDTAMQANSEQPDLVTAVHADYIAAGCNVITTNSFTLTPAALSAANRAAELPALLHAACRCASAAAATASGGRHVLVAGCLPPLNHCYLPELVPDEAEMRAQYGSIVRELAPRVDLFLAETLCCAAEARAALQAAAPSGKMCWLSLTLHDDVAAVGPPTLRGGESIPAVLDALSSSSLLPSALLYNCCAPSVVARALRTQPALPPVVQRFGACEQRGATLERSRPKTAFTLNFALGSRSLSRARALSLSLSRARTLFLSVSLSLSLSVCGA